MLQRSLFQGCACRCTMVNAAGVPCRQLAARDLASVSLQACSLVLTDCEGGAIPPAFALGAIPCCDPSHPHS